MPSRTVDISNAPQNRPSAGGNRLFSAQTPDTREGLPYVEYRADARSTHGGGSGAGSPKVAQPFTPPSPLGGAPQKPEDSSDREPPEQKKPQQASGPAGQNSGGPGGQAPGGAVAQNSSGQGHGNGWNYLATVVAPGPAYGGAAWNNGGGELANAITNGDRPASEPARPKVITGAIESAL